MAMHEPSPPPELPGLSRWQSVWKRTLDIVFSTLGLLLTGWVIVLAYVAASLSTRNSGFFTQIRAGRLGKPFRLIKIRTMRERPDITTTVTTSKDPRITRIGTFLRRSKIDELPQLLNVLWGHMSLVGPRPDILKCADMLHGTDRVVLVVRPGITGPASLRFRDEERMLSEQSDPQRYNDDVLFPEKVKINRAYVENYNFLKDLQYILLTLIPYDLVIRFLHSKLRRFRV